MNYYMEDYVQEHNQECPICMEYMVEETVLTTDCGHNLCTQCFIILSFKTNDCPLCRQQMHDYSIQSRDEIIPEEIPPSLHFPRLNCFRNLYNYFKQLYRSHRIIHPIHE